jgi:hypothetical protein
MKFACVVTVAIVASLMKVSESRITGSYTRNHANAAFVAKASNLLARVMTTSSRRYGDTGPEPNHCISANSESEDSGRPKMKMDNKVYMPFRPDHGKRIPFRSDLGRKRSSMSSYDVLKRYAGFRSDLGKRRHIGLPLIKLKWSGSVTRPFGQISASKPSMSVAKPNCIFM